MGYPEFLFERGKGIADLVLTILFTRVMDKVQF